MQEQYLEANVNMPREVDKADKRSPICDKPEMTTAMKKMRLLRRREARLWTGSNNERILSTPRLGELTNQRTVEQLPIECWANST